MEKLVILGNGPAGLTAAIYASRANLSPVVYAGPQPGGLLTMTSEIENFPGFPDGIGGFDLVMAMQTQAEKFGARIEFDSVVKAELTDGGTQKLILENGDTVETEALIIAAGAAPRYLGLAAEKRLYGHGVSACATCDGAFYKGVPVVVVGGGDSAMEEALFLTRFASVVHVVHRRDELRASPVMAERAKKHPGIRFHWSCTVKDILGADKVEGVLIEDLKTGAVETIPCRGYFSALGHIPNTGPRVFQILRSDFADQSRGGLRRRRLRRPALPAGDHRRRFGLPRRHGCRKVPRGNPLKRGSLDRRPPHHPLAAPPPDRLFRDPGRRTLHPRPAGSFGRISAAARPGKPAAHRPAPPPCGESRRPSRRPIHRG